MFPELTGHEREFDGIKDFIWNGGEISQFVQQRSDQFIGNFQRGMRPIKWMHILAIKRDGGFITGYVQLFAGPRSLPPHYTVRISRDPSAILTKPHWSSHQYVILTTSPMQVPQGCHGRRKPRELCVDSASLEVSPPLWPATDLRWVWPAPQLAWKLTTLHMPNRFDPIH